MRVGKLPEKVWKRSVLKQIKEKREEDVYFFNADGIDNKIA